MPWFKLSESKKQEFHSKILIYLFLGGFLEFAGCQMMMVSFNLGQKAHLNDGITSALILFGGVFVLILSYFLYHERINLIQGIGMFIIITGVFVISICKAQPPEEILIQTHAQEGTQWEKFGCIASSKYVPSN